MRLILFLMNQYINIFKNMEHSVQYSKSSIIRKRGKKFVGFSALLFFAYIIATFIYGFTLFLPKLSVSINYNQLMILYVILLISIASYTLFYENREIIKEFDVFYSVLNRISSNADFKIRHLWIFIFYIISMTILTIMYTSLYFVFQKIILVTVFWTSIFITMFVYGKAKEESIKSKKFIVVLILTPVILISLFKSSTINLDNPLTILVLLVSSYIALDRIINSYMELRKEIYEGKSLFFMVNSFSISDFNKLWRKIKVNSIDELLDVDDSIIVGITALMKSNNDVKLARTCFKKCIEKDSLNHIAIYYNAISYINENPEEAIFLLDKVCEIQGKNKKLEIRLSNVNLCKVTALLNIHSSDYNKIIQLITNQLKMDGLIPTEYKYILGICYVKILKFKRAKEILETLNYDKEIFSDIPYWLAVIELESGGEKVMKIKELIKIAENLNNDCEELKSKLQKIKK